MSASSHRVRGTPPDRPYLNTRQSAHFLCLSVRKLEQMRADGTGPRFRRHGRLVFYRMKDLESWSLATTAVERGDG